MPPIDNPEYRAQADKLIASATAIKNAAQKYGVKSTAFTMTLLGELMTTSQIVGTFTSLPKDQKDEFLAEVWDAAIGNEPGALVNHISFMNPDTLEQITDALKAGVVEYLNSRIAVPHV